MLLEMSVIDFVPSFEVAKSAEARNKSDRDLFRQKRQRRLVRISKTAQFIFVAILLH